MTYNSNSKYNCTQSEHVRRMMRVHDQWRETERRRLLAQLGPGYAAISG